MGILKLKKLHKLLKVPIFSTHFWNMKSVKIKTIVPSTTVKWASTKWKHNLKEKNPAFSPSLKIWKFLLFGLSGGNTRDLKKKKIQDKSQNADQSRIVPSLWQLMSQSDSVEALWKGHCCICIIPTSMLAYRDSPQESEILGKPKVIKILARLN